MGMDGIKTRDIVKIFKINIFDQDCVKTLAIKAQYFGDQDIFVSVKILEIKTFL